MKRVLRYFLLTLAIVGLTMGAAEAKKKDNPGEQRYRIEAPTNVAADAKFLTTAQHFTAGNLVILAFNIGQGFTYCADVAEGPKKSVEITCSLSEFDPVMGRDLSDGAEGIVYERVEKQFDADHPLVGTSYWTNVERGKVLIFVH